MVTSSADRLQWWLNRYRIIFASSSFSFSAPERESKVSFLFWVPSVWQLVSTNRIKFSKLLRSSRMIKQSSNCYYRSPQDLSPAKRKLNYDQRIMTSQPLPSQPVVSPPMIKSNCNNKTAGDNKKGKSKLTGLQVSPCWQVKYSIFIYLFTRHPAQNKNATVRKPSRWYCWIHQLPEQSEKQKTMGALIPCCKDFFKNRVHRLNLNKIIRQGSPSLFLIIKG